MDHEAPNKFPVPSYLSKKEIETMSIYFELVVKAQKQTEGKRFALIGSSVARVKGR